MTDRSPAGDPTQPSPDPRAFSPSLARFEATDPSPLGRAVLWTLLALLASTFLWAAFAPLDIVAVAEGKLVPSGYLKIVQSVEAGVVVEVLVREGERVAHGQLLARMDAALLVSDGRALRAEYLAKRLLLRRVDAQLTGSPLARPVDSGKWCPSRRLARWLTPSSPRRGESSSTGR